MDEQNQSQSTGESTPDGSAPANMNTPNTNPNSSEGDSSHKTMAIIGYIIPIIFFVPLLSDAKHDPFAKFHANQQLNLLLTYVVAQVVVIIPVLGWIASPIITIAAIVLAIMGLINAANNRMKELPLIGGWQLLK